MFTSELRLDCASKKDKVHLKLCHKRGVVANRYIVEKREWNDRYMAISGQLYGAPSVSKLDL